MEWLSCVGNWVNRGFTWPKAISHMMSKCQNGCIAFLLAELDKVQNHNSWQFTHLWTLPRILVNFLITYGSMLGLNGNLICDQTSLGKFCNDWNILWKKACECRSKLQKQSWIQIRNFSLCYFCPCQKILLQSVDVANKQRRNQKQKYKQTAIKTLPCRYWKW